MRTISIIDPESARFQFKALKNGWARLNRQTTGCCIVKVWVNAKNRLGGYTGKQPYWFVLKGDRIVLYTNPDFVPEANWADADPPALSLVKVREKVAPN